jgi:hypothetical protein
MKFYFNSSETNEAMSAKDKFVALYGQNKVENADIIVPIGGDGFLLKNFHDFHELKKPFFGLNYGSVGFLMNSQSDENLEKALEKRQDWLVKNNLALIQSNGDFALRKTALRDLTVMEVHQEGKFLATKAGLEFNAQKVGANKEYTYLGHTELESGKWAVVMQGKDLQMARLDKAPEIEKGSKIIFNELDRGTFQMKAAEQVKQQEQVRASDKDQEREL